MMNYDGSQVYSQFLEEFGKDITPTMMRWLLKFAKHIRGRCRSNAALKNYLVRNFPTLAFVDVPKVGKMGKPYTAIGITTKAAKMALKKGAVKVEQPVPILDSDEDEE